MKMRIFLSILSLIIGTVILVIGIQSGRLSLWNIHEIMQGDKLVSEVLFKQDPAIEKTYLENPSFEDSSELCLKNDAALWLLGHKIFNFNYHDFDSQIQSLPLEEAYNSFVKKSFSYSESAKHTNVKITPYLVFESVNKSCRDNLIVASNIIFSAVNLIDINTLAKRLGKNSELTQHKETQSFQLKYQRFLFIANNNGKVKDFFIRDFDTLQLEGMEQFSIVKNVL